jgi:hypothetical protein
MVVFVFIVGLVMGSRRQFVKMGRPYTVHSVDLKKSFLKNHL